jgi:hypothetical protein
MERSVEMESWQIFSKGIPRGKRRELARLLGLSEDTIGMWCREPLSGENSTGTGALNPIDRLDAFFDFCLLHSPETAEILAARYPQKLETFYSRFTQVKADWREKLRALIKETSEAIQAAVDSSADELEREGNEAITAIREAIRARRQAEECERTGMQL